MLTEFETAHAASVADPDEVVLTERIPSVQKPRILIGAVVKKPPEIVAAFLRTLQWQRIDADLEYCFLHDDADEQARALLSEVGEVLVPPDETVGYAEGTTTRQWSSEAFARMSQLRNTLLLKAVVERYDAIFLIDADVMCDPYTLESLIQSASPIVSGVFWSQWQPDQPPLPQVWLAHPYQLFDNYGFGQDPQDFLWALQQRQRLRVGGLGAVTLIRTDPIRKGVTYERLPEGLPPGPMSDGEDRHFCERARRLHVPLVADAWPDIWHCYRSDDLGRSEAILGVLEREHPKQATLGNLVNVRIDALDPILTPRGVERVQPQFVRGRLGALPVLPQIEQIIAKLPVGERAIEKIGFSAAYPYAPVRGKNQLVSITLLDAKEYADPIL